jgi:transaldolase
MANAIEALRRARTAVCLDDLSRSRISSGSLSEMVERGDVVGITANPAVFAKAIDAGWTVATVTT